MSEFQTAEDFAKREDAIDPLKGYRDRFHFPKVKNGEPLYFVGNSLGLQPKKVAEYVSQEMGNWATLAIRGHLEGGTPWYSYHECLTDSTARLVGAKPSEVVVMNSLTVNLHLMLVSFYRPTKDRFKIFIEAGAFPSDYYAVASQVKWHGLDPKEAIVELKSDDIPAVIEREGKQLALVLLGDVNYLSGQAFDLEDIARACHEGGAVFGVDLAHGAGNLVLKLHDWQVDFAVWCSYKYLNAGPGAIAGCFVHESHAKDFDRPRLAGWWGHDKVERFKMEPAFKAMPGAEGWQVSNPPILQMAALRASMEIFDEVGMPAVRKKSDRLTGYLEFMLKERFGSRIRVVTPKSRGSHLSFEVGPKGKALVTKLHERNVFCDFREPGILRVAPVALYNSFLDVYRFVNVLNEIGI